MLAHFAESKTRYLAYTQFVLDYFMNRFCNKSMQGPACCRESMHAVSYVDHGASQEAQW